MSTHKFPYRTKYISLGTVTDPLIRLQINTKNGWQSVWMLVDTGADTTTLPLILAQKLEINYDKSRKEKLCGIGDEVVYGYETTLQIKFNGTILHVRSHLLDTHQHMLLLGRMDIFDYFTLIFDNEKKEIQFVGIK